jgi:hypothetical protein
MNQVEEQLRHMGPVDYVVLAWPGPHPSDGRIASMIVDLADRGIIRVLDIAFATKDEDGTVTALALEDISDDSPFAVFDGASSGLLDIDDIRDAAESMEPGTAGAILVWENAWAAPIATAIRESGGLLIDGGRIPVQGIIAALDALEAAEAK